MFDLNLIRLARLPMSAKLLLTATLMTLGTGYLFALSNVALKVGFTQERVSMRYYGNDASRRALDALQEQETTISEEAGVDEGDTFSFDDLEQDEAVSNEPIVSIPSFEALVSEGHFHLFGYSTIFFVCGIIMVFAEVRAWLKYTLIIAPFAASVLDIWSMLLTRFVGPGFAWMLIISGMVMSMSFLFVFVIGIYQLWFLNEKNESVNS